MQLGQRAGLIRQLKYGLFSVALSFWLAMGGGGQSVLAQSAFYDGFESGSLSDWTTGAGYTAQTTLPAKGSYGLQLTGGSGNGSGTSSVTVRRTTSTRKG